MSKRVVITGIGVVSANGMDKKSFWKNIFKGVSYVKYDKHMYEIGSKSRVNCSIENFDWNKVSKEYGFLNLDEEARFIKLALIAGAKAFEDSKLEIGTYNSKECGTIFASAIGGTPTFEDIYKTLVNSSTGFLEYKPIGKHFYNAGMLNYPANILGQKYKFYNRCVAISTGCTGGIDALGMGYDAIRSGEVKIIMANASEAPLADITYATLDSIGALCTAEGAYETRSRPFEQSRAGFVIGEGAAALILEELEHAVARKANIYGEIIAYNSKNNALHMTDLEGEGDALANTITEALQQANISKQEIDYINAHGSSTKQNDLYETKALKKAFGEFSYKINISSTKSMIGHSLASASMMGVIAILGSLKYDKVHPTINLDKCDPECDLNYTPNISRDRKINKALLTASGFGGIHSVGIFSKYEGESNGR
jgi:3-oxoacyl-(acyl-carrier-protein) synthase